MRSGDALGFFFQFLRSSLFTRFPRSSQLSWCRSSSCVPVTRRFTTHTISFLPVATRFLFPHRRGTTVSLLWISLRFVRNSSTPHVGILHSTHVLLTKRPVAEARSRGRKARKSTAFPPGIPAGEETATAPPAASRKGTTGNSNGEGPAIPSSLPMKPSFYAVAVGRERGIYSTWDQCKSQVDGHSGAVYKSFRTLSEARAFLDAHPASGGTRASDRDDAPASRTLPSRPPMRPVPTCNDWGETDEAPGPAPPLTQRPRVETTSSSSTDASQRPSLTATSSSSFSSHHQVVYVDGACSRNGTPHARAGYGGYYGSSDDTRNFSLPVPRNEAQTNNRGELRAVIHGIVQGFVDAGAPREALDISHCVAPDWHPSELSRPLHRLVINTDSRYVIDGLTRYSARWVENGFKLATKEPVLNQDLWKQLIRLRDAYNTCYAQQQHDKESRHPYAAVHQSPAPPPKRFHTHNTRNDETEGIELRHVKGHSNDHGNEMADMMAVRGSRMHDDCR